MRMLTCLSFAMVASAAVLKRQTASIDIEEYTESPLAFIYPPPRSGFNATTAAYDPCGNMAVSSTRTNFPLSSGDISIQSIGVTANANIMFVNSSDPSAFHQFETYTSTILDMSPGDYCTASPDFEAQGLTAGSEVTLMLFYQLYGTETYYYQCADITLVSDDEYSAPSYTCSNTSTILNVAGEGSSTTLNSTDGESSINGQTISIYASAATATTSSSSGLSAAAGGGIGAVVAIVVCAALLFAGVIGGWVRIGRRRVRLAGRDDASLSSTVPLKTLH